MSTHDAPRLQQTAAELQHLEQQPWPRNPFGEPASIAELMAESAHRGEKVGGACSEHKEYVSQPPASVPRLTEAT
jgi:hypothetical protein